MKTKEAVNSTEEKDIVVSRLINAPRETVYKAFTDPKQMAEWWGPFGFTNPVCELDVKVGGKWRVEQKGPDGKIYKFGGEYKELIKNERIVWAFRYEGVPASDALGIITFEDKGGKTLINIITRLATAEQRDGMMKFGATLGTAQAFERLEDMLNNYSTRDKELRITRIINAPRELVFEAWTNPEHIKHWWGPEGFTNTIYKMDVKQGGEWHFTMHGPDGTDFRNTHVFSELVKNEKLVLTHTTEPKFRMEVWFIPQGEKQTLLTVKSQFESAGQLKELIKVFKADVGLKQNIDKLERYMEKFPAENELVIMRQFNAPRELVFKAWTNPESLARWWGPKGANISISKLELKPGGIFLYSMKNPNGEDVWGKFVYKEITAPEKLIFVNSFSDKDGGTSRNPWMPVWPLEILNTVTLTEHEGKTTLVIKGRPINATAGEMQNFHSFRDSMQGGFAGTFDQLDEYLAQAAR